MRIAHPFEPRPNGPVTFVPTEVAFEAARDAIAAGMLLDGITTFADFADTHMYMGTDNRGHAFKHVDSRCYIRVPVKVAS